MKNFLIWLQWKLFASIETGTCHFIYETLLSFDKFKEYTKFIIKNGAIPFRIDPCKADYLQRTHPKTYKQMRRDFMWRFLVKGER